MYRNQQTAVKRDEDSYWGPAKARLGPRSGARQEPAPLSRPSDPGGMRRRFHAESPGPGRPLLSNIANDDVHSTNSSRIRRPLNTAGPRELDEERSTNERFPVLEQRSFVRNLLVSLAGVWTLGCAADASNFGEGPVDEEVDRSELPFTAGAIHEIRAQHSDKCLDVAAAGTANGTNIQQWNCNSTSAQRFRIEARGAGFYRLVAQNSSKCVDIAGSGLGDGVNAQLWTCNGTAAQDFRLEATGGRHRLVNRSSGKCLDVAWASPADGANVAQVTCNGNAAQSWTLTPVGGSSGGNNGTAGVTGPIGTGPITIAGRQVRVGGAPIEMRGVCWNPVPRGGVHPQNLDFAGFVDRDLPLMKNAGVNVVRTYEPILNRAVLDKLHAAGIKVAMTVYSWGGADPSVAVSHVNAVKNHPAVLLWLVGNEWNYNGLYVGMSFDASRDRLQQVASMIRGADASHPIATIYGDVPSAATVAAMPAIDVWGINTYRGYSFGNLFSTWAGVSGKPMFVAEYGADAWDARTGSANLTAQADATRNLATEIVNNSTLRGGSTFGGTIFEWADEWWKDGAGSPWNQESGGIAPGGGPHPDAVFNEEWWGIVTLDRQTRPAYESLRSVYTAL